MEEAIGDYKILVSDVFSTPEFIRFIQGRPYKSDPIFRSNELKGRWLKKNAERLGIEEIKKGVNVNVDGVKTRASIWRIL